MFLPHVANLSYQWLVSNNLWKSTVAFFVACTLGWVVGHKPWKRHREAQAHMEDLLNTETPGGLQVIKDLLERNDDDDDAPQEADDNGSDMPTPQGRKKRKLGGGHSTPEASHDAEHTVTGFFTRIGSTHGGGK
jgi:hypothetical protein